MRDVLAERLLAKVMKWSQEDVARERPILEALAAFKYDDYQQFSPGMRFVESLALWLEQFNTDDERNEAYDFVRKRLIFISSSEMAHLVSIAYPDFIRPLLIQQTSNILQTHKTFINRVANSIDYKVLLRQSLFLGLSDGARTDLFRRNNPEIRHEQVWQTYEVSKNKADEMIEEMRSDLSELLGKEPSSEEARFKIVFLLDDFSGSGLSYLRKDPNESKYAGKIHKVLQGFFDSDGWLNKIADSESLYIYLILYIATEQGLNHLKINLRDCIEECQKEHGAKVFHSIIPIHTLSSSVKLCAEKDGNILSLIKDYFDESIINRHYKTGKHDYPYLGFDECALPVILNHNTPNNSLPILWFEKERKYRGLFPRVSRHRSE